MCSFIDESLLTKDCGLTHHEKEVYDEEMSPTLENLAVLLWLQLIHPDLPRLVKEQFGAELRRQTLASLQCEISQCLPSLLAKVNETNAPTCPVLPSHTSLPHENVPSARRRESPTMTTTLLSANIYQKVTKHS